MQTSTARVAGVYRTPRTLDPIVSVGFRLQCLGSGSQKGAYSKPLGAGAAKLRVKSLGFGVYGSGLGQVTSHSTDMSALLFFNVKVQNTKVDCLCELRGWLFSLQNRLREHKFTIVRPTRTMRHSWAIEQSMQREVYTTCLYM